MLKVTHRDLIDRALAEIETLDIEQAEASVKADQERIINDVRASEGGTDGLNSGVRRMIGAATTCADVPGGATHPARTMDASTFTRPWFAWANSLFGELIVKLSRERPHLIGINASLV